MLKNFILIKYIYHEHNFSDACMGKCKLSYSTPFSIMTIISTSNKIRKYILILLQPKLNLLFYHRRDTNLMRDKKNRNNVFLYDYNKF
jgi:hypothetical protein